MARSALLIVRTGLNLVYFHDRELATKFLDSLSTPSPCSPSPTSLFADVQHQEPVIGTASLAQKIIAHHTGNTKTLAAGLQRLRQYLPQPLLRKLELLNKAASVCRHTTAVNYELLADLEKTLATIKNSPFSTPSSHPPSTSSSPPAVNIADDFIAFDLAGDLIDSGVQTDKYPPNLLPSDRCESPAAECDHDASTHSDPNDIPDCQPPLKDKFRVPMNHQCPLGSKSVCEQACVSPRPRRCSSNGMASQTDPTYRKSCHSSDVPCIDSAVTNHDVPSGVCADPCTAPAANCDSPAVSIKSEGTQDLLDSFRAMFRDETHQFEQMLDSMCG